MKNATAVERPLSRPASWVTTRQRARPRLARARQQCVAISRDLWARALHASNVRRNRSLATLRRCQRLTITIATATAAVSRAPASTEPGVREAELPPTRGTKRDRLATSAAFRASTRACAARHLASAARFTRANAPAAAAWVDRRREAVVVVRRRHLLRGPKLFFGRPCCVRKRRGGRGSGIAIFASTGKHAKGKDRRCLSSGGKRMCVLVFGHKSCRGGCGNVLGVLGSACVWPIV